MNQNLSTPWTQRALELGRTCYYLPKLRLQLCSPAKFMLVALNFERFTTIAPPFVPMRCRWLPSCAVSSHRES